MAGKLDPGEIEARPAPVKRRQCITGPRVGRLCKESSDCFFNPCEDRNVFDLTVGVQFSATVAELDAIKSTFTAAGEWIFDATDGQLQIGQVTIWNNAKTLTGSHIQITETGSCQATAGTWGLYAYGNLTASITKIMSSVGPGCLAHELSHLVFELRDEYFMEAPGCGGNAGGIRHCPLVESGEEPCLMECCPPMREGTEFCWGLADPQDPLNLSGGNHEPFNQTSQSVCCGNRSCWDQIGWSWPNTFLVPSGAPDPEANGKVMNPIIFLQPPSTARIVLVLDSSGSMGLETPTRLERLQTAALNTLGLIENGVEIGMVIFSTGVTDTVGIVAWDDNREAMNNRIKDLMPMGGTNIGSALNRARNMILDKGSVTPGTAIILMTDGVNTQPFLQARQSLEAALDKLREARIPVFVTCTGDDVGLDWQCADIATSTGGYYLDAAKAAELAEKFSDFYEWGRGRHPTQSLSGSVIESEVHGYMVDVEPAAGEATFLVLWDDAETVLEMTVNAPDGTDFPGLPIHRGAFVRVPNPELGPWAVTIEAVQVTDTDQFVARTYIENQKIAVPLALRHKTIQLGEAFELYAYPMYEGPLEGAAISGIVRRPDGGISPVDLLDDGGVSGSGDERPGDGVYTLVYTDTAALGAYTFEMDTDVAAASRICDLGDDCTFPVGDYTRQTRVSGTVDDRLRTDCPRFDDPPTPPDGSILYVDAGEALSVPVQASHADGAVDVSLGHLGLPTGAVFAHSPANPATGNLNWTTTEGDAGTHFVIFTATDGTCTQANAVEVRVVCDPLCISVAVDAAGGGDPILSMGAPAGCTNGGVLPSAIDLVRGNLSAVQVAAGHVSLGSVEPVACATLEEKHGFCSGRLDPGAVEFFLARNVGVAAYGTDFSGLPRIADSSDCP